MRKAYSQLNYSKWFYWPKREGKKKALHFFFFRESELHTFDPPKFGTVWSLKFQFYSCIFTSEFDPHIFKLILILTSLLKQRLNIIIWEMEVCSLIKFVTMDCDLVHGWWLCLILHNQFEHQTPTKRKKRTKKKPCRGVP